MSRQFLSLTDISREELLLILEAGKALKEGGAASGPQPLAGKTLLLLFRKPSTRTRISFQVGMHQLGGQTIDLHSRLTQINRGECIEDTARVFSRYADGIVIRTFGHEELSVWSRYSTIPVINGLTDKFHPCQILADIMSIREAAGTFEGRKVAYIGDGNNVLNSWIKAACMADFELVFSTPPGYEPDPEIMIEAERTGFRGKKPRFVGDPREAVGGADVIYTDVWTSMGQEEERQARLASFRGFQVNENLVSLAKEDVLVMHCLPAHRGEEITGDVIDGPHSIIFAQAENRLHVQKALLLFLLHDGELPGNIAAGSSI